MPNGYVKVYAPNHPVVKARGPSSTDRCLPEHRIAWERHHRRWLKLGEQVHHKDGNRANNHPSNLELWTRHQPTGRRIWDILKDKVACASRNASHVAHIRAVIYLLVANYEDIIVRALQRSGRWTIYPRERRRAIEAIKQERQDRMRRLRQARQRQSDQSDQATQRLPG